MCRNEQPSRTSLYLYEGESIYKSYVSANRRSFHHSCRRTREAVLPFSFGSKLEMLTFSFQIRKRANFSCNCHEAYNMSRIRSRKNQPRQRFLVLIYKLNFFFCFFFWLWLVCYWKCTLQLVIGILSINFERQCQQLTPCLGLDWQTNIALIWITHLQVVEWELSNHWMERRYILRGAKYCCESHTADSYQQTTDGNWSKVVAKLALHVVYPSISKDISKAS